MIDTGTGKVEYISPNVRRILGISTEAVQEDFHVLCSAGGYHCRSRLDDLMQMEPGTQQEWNREFIHQETGEPRYIHVTGLSMMRRVQKSALWICLTAQASTRPCWRWKPHWK